MCPAALRLKSAAFHLFMLAGLGLGVGLRSKYPAMELSTVDCQAAQALHESESGWLAAVQRGRDRSR